LAQKKIRYEKNKLVEQNKDGVNSFGLEKLLPYCPRSTRKHTDLYTNEGKTYSPNNQGIRENKKKEKEKKKSLSPSQIPSPPKSTPTKQPRKVKANVPICEVEHLPPSLQSLFVFSEPELSQRKKATECLIKSCDSKLVRLASWKKKLLCPKGTFRHWQKCYQPILSLLKRYGE